MAIKTEPLPDPVAPDPVAPDAEPPGKPGPARQTKPEMFSQLVDDGRHWLRAEAAVYRAEARRRLIAAAIIAGLFAVAAVIAFAALSTALFGAILALAPRLGAGGATLVVVVGALIMATLLALVGRWRLRVLVRGTSAL